MSLYFHLKPNYNIKIKKRYRKLLIYYFLSGNEKQTCATLKGHLMFILFNNVTFHYKNPIDSVYVSYIVPSTKTPFSLGVGSGTYYKF